jgi:ketosteroid isomerase-like protein
MTNAKIIMVLAASAALLPGCEQAQRQNATEAMRTNTAADEQVIRGHVDHWLELVRNKDAAAIAQFYTEDGAVMPPNMPIAKGRPAIQRVWASMMDTPGFDLTFEPEEIIISGSSDMALDRGTYRLGEDTGKYVVVWRKMGGEWKVAADIFNSDKPAG